jgi:hypothetical protein
MMGMGAGMGDSSVSITFHSMENHALASCSNGASVEAWEPRLGREEEGVGVRDIVKSDDDGGKRARSLCACPCESSRSYDCIGTGNTCHLPS